MPSVSKEPPTSGVNPNASLDFDSSSKPYSEEELQRQKKLAAFLVKNEVSSPEELFKGKNMEAVLAAMKVKGPDLLLINRSEGESPRPPMTWYKPWTWFSGGSQVGSLRWGDIPPPQIIITEGGDSKESVKEEEETSKAKSTTTTGDTKHKKKEQEIVYVKRSGLPTQDMSPLQKDAIEQLTPTVAKNREKLLKAGANIHELLEGVEDTRYRYLIPSMDLMCEKEISKVIQCYEKANASAIKKQEAIRKQREEQLKSGISNQVHSEMDLEKPVVTLDVLDCAPLVKKLRTCTDSMTKEYSKKSTN